MRVPPWVYPQAELKARLCKLLDERADNGWTLRALSVAAELRDSEFLDLARGRRVMSQARQTRLSRLLRQIESRQLVPAAGLANHGIDVRATVVVARGDGIPEREPRMVMRPVVTASGVKLELRKDRHYTHEELYGGNR